MRFTIRSALKTTMGSRARRAAVAVAAIAAVGVAVLSLSLVAAQACCAQEPDPGGQEEQSFLEILRNARPAPQPSGRVLSESESSSAESRTLVGFDLNTGREVEIPSSLAGGGRPNASPPRAPRRSQSGHEGSSAPVEAPAEEGRDLDALVATRVTAPGDPAVDSGEATAPYRLLLRFSASSGDRFFVCSAASADGLQLQTAGHCLFNHDPDGDGDTGDAGWANEVWAWEGQADLKNLGSEADHPPTGAVKAILLRSYSGWTERADPAYDVGYVTLGRRSGD